MSTHFPNKNTTFVSNKTNSNVESRRIQIQLKMGQISIMKIHIVLKEIEKAKIPKLQIVNDFFK